MERREWVRGRGIGQGAVGTVSIAYDERDGLPFAVKSVGLDSSHPAAVSSLEREIGILQSLRSPYVVAYLGDSTTREPSGTWRNLHMEYLPGGTLADLASAAAMCEADVRAYARCLAQGLSYLHAVAGVVHSDVKGRNVLVGPAPGSAKLADFGSARRTGEAVDGGQFVGGTPLWMAPEVVRGEPATPASDVWSLGCTVVEMAKGGGPPWGKELGCNLNQVLLRIGYGTELPECPSRLSKLGRDFLDKCLRRNADERWTADQLLKHPFLADFHLSTDVVRSSPRSVLDWGNLGFGDDDSSDEQVIDDGRERIRELVWDGGMVGWESDDDDDGDWEAVRIPGSSRDIWKISRV